MSTKTPTTDIIKVERMHKRQNLSNMYASKPAKSRVFTPSIITTGVIQAPGRPERFGAARCVTCRACMWVDMRMYVRMCTKSRARASTYPKRARVVNWCTISELLKQTAKNPSENQLKDEEISDVIPARCGPILGCGARKNGWRPSNGGRCCWRQCRTCKL